MKTYTAQSVSKNHDWDFSVDDDGNITKLVIKSEVNYGEMGMMEELDIWKLLNESQKSQMQSIYNKVAQVFNKQILG